MNRFLRFLEWCFTCFGTALMIVAALAAPAYLFAAPKPGGSCAATCAADYAGHPFRIATCERSCCEAQCADEHGKARGECVQNCLLAPCDPGTSEESLCQDDCSFNEKTFKCTQRSEDGKVNGCLRDGNCAGCRCKVNANNKTSCWCW